MADEPTSAGWVLPPRPTATTDTFYTNTLPGGANLPYGSLGAQLLDAFGISHTLNSSRPGYVNNRYNFSNFSPNWPGGGYPLPGGGGVGTGTGGGTGGGGIPPGTGGGGGGVPPGTGGGAPPGTGGGGLLNPPATTPPPQITHGNDTAGTGNNQFGPYAPPAAGVGDWKAAVNKLYGAGDPVALIQKAMMANAQPGMKTAFGTYNTFNPATLNAMRGQLTGAGMDPYAAAKIVDAFGGSGSGAYSAAEQLGLLGQFQAGGQQGLRPGSGWSK